MTFRQLTATIYDYRENKTMEQMETRLALINLWQCEANKHSKSPFLCVNSSLLHSRFQCRHAMLLPKWGGALRDDTKNGCVADQCEQKPYPVWFSRLRKSNPVWCVLSLREGSLLDPYTFLGNCPPTPSLSQY